MTKKARPPVEGALKPTPQWWKDLFTAWVEASEWSVDSLEKRLVIPQGSIGKMLKLSKQSRLVDKLVTFTGIPDPTPVRPTEPEHRIKVAMARVPAAGQSIADMVEAAVEGMLQTIEAAQKNQRK